MKEGMIASLMLCILLLLAPALKNQGIVAASGDGYQRFTDEKEENGSQLQDFVYPKFDNELSKNNNSNSDVKETQK
ncbi:hypothetical protein NPIL_92961 [Nephila pilipes]|uniref:Spider venom protein n=1 Tax=Nephila pilipes TaxID=299642 RepID=A0A8X6M6K3_NEPPI|nr:hypothetical protein NPIL_92961 [Nephila pilipes]